MCNQIKYCNVTIKHDINIYLVPCPTVPWGRRERGADGGREKKRGGARQTTAQTTRQTRTHTTEIRGVRRRHPAKPDGHFRAACVRQLACARANARARPRSLFGAALVCSCGRTWKATRGTSCPPAKTRQPTGARPAAPAREPTRPTRPGQQDLHTGARGAGLRRRRPRTCRMGGNDGQRSLWIRPLMRKSTLPSYELRVGCQCDSKYDKRGRHGRDLPNYLTPWKATQKAGVSARHRLHGRESLLKTSTKSLQSHGRIWGRGFSEYAFVCFCIRVPSQAVD